MLVESRHRYFIWKEKNSQISQMSEINPIRELPEVIFFLLITDQYQRKDWSLFTKYINRTYETGSSRKENKKNFNLIEGGDNFFG